MTADTSSRDDESPPPTALAGHRFGPYEVVALLATGGMGEVYRARDPRLGREVALKLLPREAVGDPRSLRRFELEARAVGALNHPNILALYDVGNEGAVPWVVTELLEGQTLRARLDAGAVALEEALDWAAQIASGLGAAHEKRIVHRDLKPANLFLTRDGVVKILDFGLAKRPPAVDAEAVTSEPTLPGTVVGTAGYMAPEQVKGHEVDARADVFAFGAVLYELLSGRRAFAAASPVETLGAILRDEPPPLALPGRAAPRALVALVKRCLHKAPERRFADGGELRRALAEARRTLATGALEIAPAALAHTLAVLPFVNLSADPEQDYFCEGLARDLVDALGKLPGLRTVAPLFAGSRGHRREDLRRLIDEVGADKVLEGSVRKAGNRLRINVQLVNVADGSHLWSERYDRELADVFALQDEIRDRVVESLRLRLGAGGAAPGGARAPADVEAYQLYLRGRFHWNKRDRAGFEAARRSFEQALEVDPGYALAWAGLAETYALMGSTIFDVLAPTDGMPKAQAAIDRALALEPDLPDAWACQGWVRLHYDWDWSAAEDAFARALAIDPGRATTYHWHAFLLSSQGRFEAAAEASRRAWECDPLALIINAQLAAPLYYARRFDLAARESEKLLELEPGFGVANFWLGLARSAQDRHDEALAALEHYAVGRGNRGVSVLGWARGRAGDLAGAERALAELAQAARARFVPTYHRALVELGLGRLAPALDGLEAALDERCDQLAYLAVDPAFDPLRGEPRFRALLTRLRLDEIAAADGR